MLTAWYLARHALTLEKIQKDLTLTSEHVSQICRLLYHVNLGVKFKPKITGELHCYSMDPIRSSMSKYKTNVR